jgi:hypothetical protein
MKKKLLEDVGNERRSLEEAIFLTDTSLEIRPLVDIEYRRR